MDEDIMNAVESLFGKDVKIVDCETSSSVQQEEVLLINGVPVKLDGLPADDASAIKSALLDGQMPAVEHLNQLLFRAGLAQQPIEVETSLTVKSSLTTTEEVLVSRNGQVLDERTVETKEHFNHQSHQKEIWQPVKPHNALARATPENALRYRTNSNSTFSSQTTTDGEPIRAEDRLGHQLNQTFSNASLISSSSALSDSDQVIGSTSNMSTATTLGEKSSNISSCDSGHDGIFHSVSMSVPYTQSNARDTQTDSMYCDIPSSADEADAVSVAMLSTHLQITEPCDLANNCQTSAAYAKDLPAAGDLNTLVSLMVSCSDEDLQFALLLCARLLVPVKVLLSKIIQQCHGREEQLLSLLAYWMRICANDFCNESLLQELRKQSDQIKALEVFLDGIPESMNRLDASRRSQLQYMLVKQPSASSFGRQNSIKSLKRLAANIYKSDNVLSKCNSAFELAHQLFAIEYAYLSQIRLEEFVEMIKTGEFKSCMLQKKAGTLGSICSSAKLPEVSIGAYVQWSNHLCHLIATEILKLGKKTQRVQMVEYWIETALECFNTGNFNSLMAILTALNMTAISRLKKTWSKVETSKFEGLEHQMNPGSNFQNYRSAMKAAIWRSEREAANKIERAIIPFFSLFLKDFYAVNESRETRLANGYFNFELFTLFGTQLRNFYKCQQMDCPYEQLESIVVYLQKADAFTEDHLLRASYECESPDGPQEKDHYKALKAAK